MRVLVLGGGYAGLVAVTRLERRLPADVELVLVDQRDRHLIRHELHRVIRRPAFAETIQVPFETILDRARFKHATVTDIDPEEGVVDFQDGESLAYDAAAVTFGAGVAYYDLPGVRANSVPLDAPADARAIGEIVEELIEAGSGNVVIGGGGLAGIQAAGEIAQARADADVEDITVTVVEQESEIAPRFDDGFRAEILRALNDLDVDIVTGASVTDATEAEIRLSDDRTLPFDCFVWTGGITGRDALDGDRPAVRADLRLAGDTFAAGDAVRIVDQHGALVTPSAQTAIREARVLATNVQRTIEAKQRGDTFRPHYERYRAEMLGWVVSVGDATVAQVGPQVLTGQPAKALKSTVGVGYLSTAGAIRESLTLVREEFGLAPPMGGTPFGRA